MHDFLRLGVVGAIVNEDGHILLSQRGDLGLWNLPSGRLDSDESLDSAVQREVFEETGLEVALERLVGLYYSPDWRRMNVLYLGRPVGGHLRQTTSETRANRFFTPDSLPDAMLRWHSIFINDAFSDVVALRILTSPRLSLYKLKIQLTWRWFKNWLRGYPEPSFPRFDVWGVLLLVEPDAHRVLTVPAGNLRTLPRVLCHGNQAPWIQVIQHLQQYGDVDPAVIRAATQFVRWVGLWQHPEHNTLEFVFATRAPLILPDIEAVRWEAVRNAALTGIDRLYVEQWMAASDLNRVWSRVVGQDTFTTITVKGDRS